MGAEQLTVYLDGTTSDFTLYLARYARSRGFAYGYRAEGVNYTTGNSTHII